jgi:hypothetical protein
MGIVESMIIGGTAGGIAAGVMLASQARRRRRLAAALRDTGDPSRTRPLVDRLYPFKGRLGILDIVPLSHRFVALGALGDLDTIRRECDALPDKRLAARVLVKGLALLIRRQLGDPSPEMATQLEALAEQIEREGGIFFRLAKRLGRAMVDAAKTVDGVPLSDEARKRVAFYAKDQLHARVVWLLVQMFDRVARGDVAGLAEMNVRIESEWPASAFAKRAEVLLASHR